MIRKLGRSGATAAEFALVLPLFLAMLFGSIQLGILFFANAGRHNAVAEAAREATLWPRRDEAQLRARLNASRFGIVPAQMGTPVITYGNTGGQDFVDIQATYTVSLNFGFFSMPAVSLSETRRAWRS
jgi:Flp pilus assembly protein TadG